MSYTALYRKFRPDTFEEVKGQDHIVNTLKNQIKADRIGHAYLFCGTRGTGKTSVAKIFARAVNCENAVDGSPCNECDTCKAINSGSALNIVEMDAASNNGVDDVRQIIEEVQYSPSVGRYTVYIIDEVHMLSNQAFNALLKTLEEPPAHVIFILATTDPQKIPITILSRCQRYDFKRISIETIANRLKELVTAESVDAEDRALKYIAKAGDGSMRDAISMLDQCIAFYIGQTLTYENVLEVLGAVDQDVFSRLFRSVASSDVIGSINILDDVVMQGRELTQFVNDFIWYLRNIMIVQGTGDASELLDVSKDSLDKLNEEAQMIDAMAVIRYIRVLSDVARTMKYSDQKRVLLEVALINLNKPAMERSGEAIINRISVLENQVKDGVKVAAPSMGNIPGTVNGPAPQAPAPKPPKPVEKAVPEDIKYVADNWNLVLNNLEISERVVVERASLAMADEKIVLLFEAGDKLYERAKEKSLDKVINELIKNEIGKDMTISIERQSGDGGGTFFQKLVSKIDFEIEEEDF